jgi:hypothetical protein
MVAEIELKLLVDPADVLKLRRMGALNDVATIRRLLVSLHTPRSGAVHSEAIGIAHGWVACRGVQFLASLGQAWDAFLQQKPFWGK